MLYPIIGLGGILPIDLATFGIAIATLVWIRIPLIILRFLVLQLVSAIATLIAGPLSDRFLEPAMQSETILSSLFAPIFGNSAGAGMALLYVVCAISLRHDFVTLCLLLARSALDYRNYAS